MKAQNVVLQLVGETDDILDYAGSITVSSPSKFEEATEAHISWAYGVVTLTNTNIGAETTEVGKFAIKATLEPLDS